MHQCVCVTINDSWSSLFWTLLTIRCMTCCRSELDYALWAHVLKQDNSWQPVRTKRQQYFLHIFELGCERQRKNKQVVCNNHCTNSVCVQKLAGRTSAWRRSAVQPPRTKTLLYKQVSSKYSHQRDNYCCCCCCRKWQYCFYISV